MSDELKFNMNGDCISKEPYEGYFDQFTPEQLRQLAYQRLALETRSQLASDARDLFDQIAHSKAELLDFLEEHGWLDEDPQNYIMHSFEEHGDWPTRETSQPKFTDPSQIKMPFNAEPS